MNKQNLTKRCNSGKAIQKQWDKKKTHLQLRNTAQVKIELKSEEGGNRFKCGRIIQTTPYKIRVFTSFLCFNLKIFIAKYLIWAYDRLTHCRPSWYFLLFDQRWKNFCIA